MVTRFGILFAVAFILAAWQSDVDAPATVVQLEFDDLPPEHWDALLQNLVEKNLGEGNSIEKDGFLLCEGFLTKFENDDYCSSVVPEDWVPFEYQGQEYYVQPLAYRERN
jgi:hypothetical protein